MEVQGLEQAVSPASELPQNPIAPALPAPATTSDLTFRPRTRRIKCDETRPSCQQCRNTGRHCDGYTIALGNAAVAPSSRLGSITSYAIPFKIPGGQKERRLLHYFCVKGAAELSGGSPSDFWTRLSLQRSHDQLVVRQAVAALSSLHLDLTTASTPAIEGSPSTGDADSSTLELGRECNALYNQALRSLRKYLNQGIDTGEPTSPIVPLLCSALFYCLECARGNVAAALQHLQSGAMILMQEQERRKDRESTIGEGGDAESMAVLEDMFYNLDLQATMYDDARIPLLPERTTAHSQPNATFTSIADAKASLTVLLNWLLRFLISNGKYKFWPIDQIPAAVLDERASLVRAYDAWRCGFDGLVKEHQSSPVLQIHYLVFRLLLDGSLPHDPTAFDGEPESENARKIYAILELAESAVGAQRDATPDEMPKTNGRTISAETGIVAPLFLVAMKSRDSGIVGRALSVLAASNRREGLYDARVVVGIAEKIIAVSTEQPVADELEPSGIPAGPNGPLEYRGGDAIEIRERGVEGIAKNLGVPVSLDGH